MNLTGLNSSHFDCDSSTIAACPGTLTLQMSPDRPIDQSVQARVVILPITRINDQSNRSFV